MKLAELRSWLATLADAEATIPARQVLDRLPAAGDAITRDLTCEEVAKAVDRTPSCVRGWCRSGRLPGAYRLAGREWRIPAESFRRLRDGPPSTQRRNTTDLSAWRASFPKAG